MKIPKPPKPTRFKKQFKLDLTSKMPYIFITVFLVIGLIMVSYGYFLLNRQPEQNVVSGMQSEIDSLKLRYNKKKTLELFNTIYDTSEFKNSAYQGKDPFMSF